MKVCFKAALLAVLTVGISCTVVQATEDIKSGPPVGSHAYSDGNAGPFNVKAITGEHRKGNNKEVLCYFCKYDIELRPAIVMVFTQKADDNLASLVKAIDEVQKNDKKLGTVVIGVSGVTDADFEKLQETHKLTAPLTIATDQDGPPNWKLNPKAAVSVVIFKPKPKYPVLNTFGFADTKSAKDKSTEICDAIREAMKK